MTQELEPITPAEAKEMYLEARKQEVSEATLQGHHYRLKQFVRWCDEVSDIDNLNSLSGRDLQRFKTWRRDDGELKPVTLRNHLNTLRVFINWCESIDAVEDGLHQKLDALMPMLSKEAQQSDSILEPERASDILHYLRKFEYASREHVILELLWETGMRIGSLYSLDVDDYDSEEERLKLRHRPETGTALKNKQEGERMIALIPQTCRVIEDWLESQRHEVEDEHGRSPLITTENGRMWKSGIRDRIYRVTRPCYFSGECPKGRDMEECEGTNYSTYSKCPLNVSPHDIRRGSITHYLTEDVPEKVVSDRMNVGQDVLDKHYDKRSEEVKVEQRREYLSDI